MRLLLYCRPNIARHSRLYNFGKVVIVKEKEIIPSTQNELEFHKLQDSVVQYDFSQIEAQVNRLFDPYKSLGLDRSGSLDSLQKKIRFEIKNINLQIEKIQNDNPTDDYALDIDRLGELRNRLQIVEKSKHIFSSSSERKKFDDNYALQVHNIIHSQLTLGQKVTLRLDKLKQSMVQKYENATPAPIQASVTHAVKVAALQKTKAVDKISLPKSKATIYYGFFPWFFMIFIFLPMGMDGKQDNFHWHSTKALYPPEKYTNLVFYFMFWWSALKGFWTAYAIKTYKNIVLGMSKVDREAEYSVVKEYEKRDTELMQLALEFEKLKKANSP